MKIVHNLILIHIDYMYFFYSNFQKAAIVKMCKKPQKRTVRIKNSHIAKFSIQTKILNFQLNK